jgi:3-keto-5-aminohexanoate cleavage enzyme
MGTERPDRAWAPPPLRPYQPMVIDVALTGAVPTRADNPSLPMTPAEIAADVLACADAGAVNFHLHMRDEQGGPVHRLDLYEATIAAIRAVRTDLVLCVTTSSRVGSDLASRMIGMEVSADLRPEFASLSLGSFNFPRTVSVNPPDQIRALLTRMNELGIRPEFEVFEAGMVNTLWQLRDEGLVPEPPVVNILLGSSGSAPAFVSELARIVERLPADAVWAAAGIGVFQRPMTIAAAVMGGNVRTGLEDNPRGDTGGPWSNAAAVRLAVDAAALAGRPVATPAQARAAFALPSWS